MRGRGKERSTLVKRKGKRRATHVVGPLVGQTVLGDVSARDHARDAVLLVEHDEVAQAHGAKEAVAARDGARLVEAVGRRVHVSAHVHPQIHVLLVQSHLVDGRVVRVVALNGVVENGGGRGELDGAWRGSGLAGAGAEACARCGGGL